MSIPRKHCGCFAFPTTGNFNLCVSRGLAAHKIDILSVLILCPEMLFPFWLLEILAMDDDE